MGVVMGSATEKAPYSDWGTSWAPAIVPCSADRCSPPPGPGRQRRRPDAWSEQGDGTAALGATRELSERAIGRLRGVTGRVARVFALVTILLGACTFSLPGAK